MKMKVKIMIDALGGKDWIGGLYYKKNILFSLLENKNIDRKYEFILVTEPENIDIFKEFFDRVKIILFKEKNYTIKKYQLLLLCLKNKCSYIFPSGGRLFTWFGIIPIRWIPDFQHNHFPDFFSKNDIRIRNLDYTKASASNIPLILSSNDSFNDFRQFYPSKKENVYIIPFVSYIEKIIQNLDINTENRVLQKYGLFDIKYICIMNQFWKHKNHIVVLEAMKEYFENKPDDKIIFVFTGQMKDYRHPEYIEKLEKIINTYDIKKHIKLLGFIERNEQIVIMKNAEYVIQPSLFEGWGTVVEDAKVLDKTILLSDIPIHREQRNNKCILFDPYNPKALARLIEEENSKKHIDNVKKGIADMYVRAKKYSKGFENLLNEN